MKTFIEKIKTGLMNKEDGIDGILVTIGLCVIALVLCVVMKDSLTNFIQSITTSMTTKAEGILSGAGTITGWRLIPWII